MSLIIDSKFVRLLSSRLRNFKQKKDYLWNFSCPFCGDSKKNLSKARGYVFAKGNNLFYGCHNCGVGTNVANLVKQVDSSLHQEYTLERYKEGKSNTSNFKATTLNISPPRFDKLAKQKVFEYSEWCDKLPSGHFCLTYLQKRHIPQEYHSKLLFTSKYKQFIDELVPNHGKELIDDARLIIPFYDVYNDLIAVSGRALENSDKTLRYITIRTVDSDSKLVYGMDMVDLNQTVKIVEGPIDSLFLSNCLASGDANLAMVANKLIHGGVSKSNIILCPDREPRNREIVKIINTFIEEDFKVCLFPNTMIGKDINEHIMNGISSQQLEEIISKNTFHGIQLRIEFNQWKKI
jgi:transcription elongation factor Elf1